MATRIDFTKVIGFKAETKEFIVAFRYEKKGTVLASMNLQKDAEGEWRIFSMDLDERERALQSLDSWRAQ